MKTRMTKKFANQFYNTTIEVGYGCSQHLLSGIEPEGYTCGVYGWNADIYNVGNRVAIVTGYRPFGTVKADYDTVREFDKRAEAILSEGFRWSDWDEKRKKLEALREEFVATVTA